MERKNTILLTVIAVATLLVAVVGATFAYFTATTAANGASEEVDVNTSVVGTGTVSLVGNAVNHQEYLAYPGGAAVAGLEVLAKDEDANNSYSATYSIGYTVHNSTNSTIYYTVLRSKTAINTELACEKVEKEKQEGTDEYRWYYKNCPGLSAYQDLDIAVSRTPLVKDDAETTEKDEGLVTSTFVGTALNTDAGDDSKYYYYILVEYPDTKTTQNTDQGLNISAQLTGITGAVTSVITQ